MFRLGIKPQAPIDDRSSLSLLGEKVGQLGIGAAKELGDQVKSMGDVAVSGVTNLALGPVGAIPGVREAANDLVNPIKEDIQQTVGLTDENLTPSNPTQEIGGTAAMIAGFASPFAVSAPAKVASIGRNLASKIGTAADTPLATGAVQTAKEVAERVPRFLGRVKEGAKEASDRAQQLKTSSPAQTEALKSGLDERFNNFIAQADKPTLTATKEMLDLAEKSTAKKGATFTVQDKPSIVAGRAAEKQYDLIDKNREKIGKAIEKEADSIPNQKVNMRPSVSQIEGVLQQNGVTIKDGALDISGSTLSTAQGARLQELYNTATRPGDVINAKMVHGMDRLFSQLQREARFDDLDNIFLNVNGKDVNAFKLFRDIYRNQLDNLSPNMRELNKQYSIYRQFVDEMEDSIFKTGDFETAKNVDGAEFAKNNLRRVFSNAQSAPAYRAIVQKMDKVSRELGYDGAVPEDLAAVAIELQKLFPETIQQTSATGIVGGVKELLGKVLSAGEPTTVDQQRALRKLIEEALSKQ